MTGMEAIWNNILSYLKLQFGTLDFNMLLNELAYDKDSPLIFSSGMFMLMFSVFIVIYTILKNKSLMNRIILINNNFKCKWVECPNQKTKTG